MGCLYSCLKPPTGKKNDDVAAEESRRESGRVRPHADEDWDWYSCNPRVDDEAADFIHRTKTHFLESETLPESEIQSAAA